MVRLDACKFFPHLLSFAPLPWHTVWSVDVICGLGALSVCSGSGVSQSFIATSFCSFQAYCSGVLISFVVFLSLAEVGCIWSVCLLLLKLSFPYWRNASCCMCLLHLVTVLLCKLLAFLTKLVFVKFDCLTVNTMPLLGASADLFILWTASVFFLFNCVSLLVGTLVLFLDITDRMWTQQYVFKPNSAFQ